MLHLPYGRVAHSRVTYRTCSTEETSHRDFPENVKNFENILKMLTLDRPLHQVDY